MTTITHALIKPGTIEARLYQEVLVSRVIEKGNTLVVAPTALGKTIVAVMVAAHTLAKSPKSKILFLAPTKPLTTQHEKSFRKFLAIDDEKIVSITGDVPQKERESAYRDATVIHATPQTIENDILGGRLNLRDFALVIFDEAHRAVGEYAYVFINLQLQKQNPFATVLALTASPGSEEEKIQDVCRNLSIKNIEIKNSGDKDVSPYVNDIEIDWVRVDLPASFLSIKQKLEEFQKKQIIFLKHIGIAVTENKKYYNRLRILEMQGKIRARLMAAHGTQPSLFVASSRCAALLKVAHAEELIETQGIGALNNYFEKLAEESRTGKSKAATTIVKDEDIHAAMLLTRKLFEEKVQHPKYAELKRIVLKQLREQPQSKILVFNHYRDSISEVVSFLQNNDDELLANGENPIKATKFIGQATKGKEKGMTQKLQQSVLEELRNGTHNVLVSSSVAEEGLDIPAVELVVFFEPVPSEIRTIQRRGRTGRFGKGKTIILMARNTRDEVFYWTARAKEKKMQSTLKEMKKNGAELTAQTNLGSFEKDPSADQIVIFIDSREQASIVTKLLFERGAKTMVKQLSVGDYVLSKDVCVERKTIEDFISSIIDGRLFKQMVDLRTSYAKPLIIIEGNMDSLFTLRNIHRNAIIGALTSIALDYQVPIMNTKNDTETAEYLFSIAKREQVGKDKELRIRVGRKGLKLSDQQRFIVEGLPLVGPNLARNLLEKFGSIHGIVSADEKKLQEVEGLGKKKAALIKKVLTTQFIEKKDSSSSDDETEELLASDDEEKELNDKSLTEDFSSEE